MPMPSEPEAALTRLADTARFIEAHAEERLTLRELAERVSLSPSHLQRVFKAAFGVSPKAYQDAVRMKRFKAALKEGDDVTGAIFSAGFGSLSRVYGERSRNIGMTPRAYRAGGAGESITYACRLTALGAALMAVTRRGVCFVSSGRTRRSSSTSSARSFRTRPSSPRPRGRPRNSTPGSPRSTRTSPMAPPAPTCRSTCAGPPPRCGSGAFS